jgi:hypothetical protein
MGQVTTPPAAFDKGLLSSHICGLTRLVDAVHHAAGCLRGLLKHHSGSVMGDQRIMRRG